MAVAAVVVTSLYVHGCWSVPAAPIMAVIDSSMAHFYRTCGFEGDFRAVLDKLARDTLEGTIRGLVRQAFNQFGEYCMIAAAAGGREAVSQ